VHVNVSGSKEFCNILEEKNKNPPRFFVTTILLFNYPRIMSFMAEVNIAVRFHFLRDLVNDQIVRLRFCSTKEQIVDVMTKA